MNTAPAYQNGYGFVAGPIPGRSPDDIFVLADGRRIARRDIAGTVFQGEFRILYAGTRSHAEAIGLVESNIQET